MAQPVIQTSFVGGELSPALYARVDLKQYHAGVAFARNFFVDYRGGLTKSPGTKYIVNCINNTSAVRLIPFQASFSVNYVLVFENLKLWFIANGVPITESAKTISAANIGASQLTVNAHGYITGNRILVNGIVGTLGTLLNGNYYFVSVVNANTIQLGALNGSGLVSFAGTAYTSGGTTQRIYEVTSPYAAAELAQIKYAQDVNVMILCHPNYAPYSLTYTSATSWALAAITIGASVAAPSAGLGAVTTLAAGTWNYAYVITSVDANGQESGPSAFVTLAALQDMRTVAGTNTLGWTAVANAVSYNIYKANLRQNFAVPAGSMFGFIGNCTGTAFYDSNIPPDFSQSAPIVKNPFAGSGVQSINLTNFGAYSNNQLIPTISFTGGGGGSGAAAISSATVTAASIVSGGSQYAVGDNIYMGFGVILRVTGVTFPNGTITSIAVAYTGNLVGGQVTQVNGFGGYGTSGIGVNGTFNLTWGVTSVGITNPGSGYAPAPNVVFSNGAAAATATLGAPSGGNPTVPGFFQQRLVFAGPVANPRQFNMSQPGTYYNFNVTDPVQPDNAFQGNLVSGTLNTIQSMISQPQGLMVLSDQAAWLVNGGSPGSAVDAINTVANAQVFSGAAGPPPIVAGEDVLYVQSKNSIVRNASFNWNKQIYTGKDISVMSSHLFYGFQLLEWAWAEEPFKVAWAVRNDGTLLSLTFQAEQELIAWTHRDTQGSYKSIAAITETTTTIGAINAVYVVVSRTINGITVQFIERFAEQFYPNGVTDAWQVDAGLQYNGAATLSFTGANHLPLTDIVGLATDDQGNVTDFNATVSSTGTFSLPAPPAPATGYTRVTAGLSYVGQITTLGIDTGEPTIQGKMKLLPQVTVRVKDTIGLEIGTDFDPNNLVDMEDTIIGNVGKDTNEIVTTAMFTGDALQALDPKWQVPGQYCIQSEDPWPATILGLIPQLTVGDTKSFKSQ